MNETKVNLVASTLTNSLGTTVIGHVGVPAAVINVKYPNGKYDTVVSDNQGDFVTKAPAGVIDGKILVPGYTSPAHRREHWRNRQYQPLPRSDRNRPPPTCVPDRKSVV